MKIAGIAALGLGASPVQDAPAPKEQGPQTPQMIQGENALTAPTGPWSIDTRKLHAPRRPGADDRGLPQDPQRSPFEIENHEIKWIWGAHYHNAFPESDQPSSPAKGWNT